jgi:hypothetical protein
MEGSAVFFETWMAGGLGRAQGGYDEMVFRAKVRDGTRIYSPLGLESEGTVADFMVGANSYLYGTRFFSYLALTYGPERTVEWLRRSEDCKAFYASQFRHVFGKPLDAVWDDWIAFEQKFQSENLAALAKYPLSEAKHLSPRGLGSMSRGFIDDKTNSVVAAFRYPGRIGFLGRMDLATGKLTHLADLDGMMLYKVTSVAFDLLYQPELRLPRHQCDRCRHRTKAATADRRADRRPCLQPGRQEPVGPASPERLRYPGSNSATLHELQSGQDVSLWRDPVRSRHLARWRAHRGFVRHR